jgi:hypothetical protein
MTFEELLERFQDLINFRNCTYGLTVEHRELLHWQINAIADTLDAMMNEGNSNAIPTV